jgi:GNAT superfamily N-acetyltransferase
MEQRRVEPNDPNTQQIGRGWSFGAAGFYLCGCSTEIPGSVSEHHLARERSETDEQRAEAIIAARLKKLGWAKIVTRRKSDPQKVALPNRSALGNHDEPEKVASHATDIAYCISTVSADGCGEVDSMFVEEHFRGAGVGSELVRCALAWLDSVGASSKVVTVAHGNERALAL